MMIGQYNRLVTIEHKTVEESHLQRTAAKWETYAQAWCAIETADGTETTEEKQQRSRTRLVLTTHWSTRLDGVTSAMRVRLPGDRLAEITSAENVDRANREVRIVCIVEN